MGPEARHPGEGSRSEGDGLGRHVAPDRGRLSALDAGARLPLKPKCRCQPAVRPGDVGGWRERRVERPGPSWVSHQQLPAGAERSSWRRESSWKRPGVKGSQGRSVMMGGARAGSEDKVFVTGCES